MPLSLSSSMPRLLSPTWPCDFVGLFHYALQGTGKWHRYQELLALLLGATSYWEQSYKACFPVPSLVVTNAGFPVRSPWVPRGFLGRCCELHQPFECLQRGTQVELLQMHAERFDEVDVQRDIVPVTKCFLAFRRQTGLQTCCILLVIRA